MTTGGTILERWMVFTFLLWGVNLLCGCTDRFTDYNSDKTQMNTVGRNEFPGLFTASQIGGVNWQTTDNYSRMSSTFVNHLCGYTSCGKTPYDNNMLNEGWLNAGWTDMWIAAVRPLLTICRSCEPDDPEWAVATVWKIHLLHQMTDLWGPIPYTDGGTGVTAPVYESQREVYYKMFDQLRQAADMLEQRLRVDPALNCFGLGDMIWDGNARMWLRFCNTLRLRLACRLALIEPDKARIEAEAAVKGILLDEVEHTGLMKVDKWSSRGNGMCRMNSFFQDVMSTSMESYLKGYDDPRMGQYWSKVEQRSDFDERLLHHVGGYHGMTQGFDLNEVNLFMAHSLYGPRFADGKQLETSINVVHAAETWFLKAEGAWRGWNMGGHASDFYAQGIETSLRQWLPSIDKMAIDRYLQSDLRPVAPRNMPYNDPPVASCPVKWSDDRDTQLEQIMVQKWIALFPLSVEAYAEVRRTRLPRLYAKKYSMNANVIPSKGQIITRIPFARDERLTMPSEIERATREYLGGNPDLESTPVWWDVHPNGSVVPGRYSLN